MYKIKFATAVKLLSINEAFTSITKEMLTSVVNSTVRRNIWLENNGNLHLFIIFGICFTFFVKFCTKLY